MAESPYAKAYTHTTDIDRFFEYDAERHTLRFIGDTLEMRVPKRFEVHNLLSIADTVQTLAVADLIINDEFQASLYMLAKIEVVPSDVGQMTIHGLQYAVLHLKTGDLFMKNTQIVKEKSIVYALWVEFITRGNPIYTLQYDHLGLMFNQARSMCDSDLNVDRAVIEMIVSHLARDPNNRFVQYRHTDMKGPYEFIALRSVSYAPTSATGQLLGSYGTGDGLNAVLTRTNTVRQPFEDLLRGVSAAA